MSLDLDFSDQAIEDVAFHKKFGNKAVLKKLFILLDEIADHPFIGTGKPEALKYNLSGKWSRRINQEHRLVYEVFEDYVVIHSLKDHYSR
ncbi:MAG: Txe/YoeB family addiction module toxin [Sphingobacteriaceae bacterium]|nr:MAG: Txe/YoeB family addiction module toxin [Sphingobacteriaceae bacterium]